MRLSDAELKAEIDRVKAMSEAQKNLNLLAAYGMNKELSRQLGLQLMINRMMWLAVWGNQQDD